jgi:hypothetical protein
MPYEIHSNSVTMTSVMKARLEVGEGFLWARNVCCGMVMVNKRTNIESLWILLLLVLQLLVE